MILRKAVEAASGQSHQVSTGPLAEKLSQYAGLLASQGSLGIAMNYLGDSQEVSNEDKDLVNLRYYWIVS